MTAKQEAGIYLSVPTRSGRYDVARMSQLRMPHNQLLTSDFFEDVVFSGQQVFAALGYEDSETIYATLYQIAPNGSLDWSECFTIDGPDAH